MSTCPSDRCVTTDAACVDIVVPLCKDYKAKNTCEANTKCRVLALEACIDTPFEVNWENEKIVKVNWYDKALFTLGKDGVIKITVGMSIGVVIVIIAIALIVSAICSFIAY